MFSLVIRGFRILELEVEDENEIRWEDLAGGWSSVRSPQWLRSKWWSIKRQVTNHKDIPFSGNHGNKLLLVSVFCDHVKNNEAGFVLKNKLASNELMLF